MSTACPGDLRMRSAIVGDSRAEKRQRHDKRLYVGGGVLTRPVAPGRIRGRQREVSTLEEQLRVLVEGHGSITVVEGSPGAGKTRLLEEAMSIADRLGVSVGAGRARRGDRVVMMGALLDAVAGGPRPLLARQSLRDIEGVLDLRYWLVQEIEAMLERAASTGPILIVIDDLQWADGGTVGALEELALRLAAPDRLARRVAPS
jgi:hypothetical protein